MPSCNSCERIAARNTGLAPIWDNIYRGAYWDLAHAYNTSYLGWMVLILRRHAEAIADLNADEARELGLMQRAVSLALKRHTGCLKTYVMQFAEAAQHPHVHFHIVPRMHNQKPADISYNILHRLGAPEGQRCSEADMIAFSLAIRSDLDDSLS